MPHKKRTNNVYMTGTTKYNVALEPIGTV